MGVGVKRDCKSGMLAAYRTVETDSVFSDGDDATSSG